MLIDTHSHLHFPAYDEDRDKVHERMREFGVKTITIGTAMNTSRAAAEYAMKHLDTWAAVGYHPDHLTNRYIDENEPGVYDEPYDIDKLKEIALSSDRVLAIGECGLDYHYFDEKTDIEEAKKIQIAGFMEQADLAAELSKTLIVHMRDSAEDMVKSMLKIRENHPTLRIVIHSFTDTWDVAERLLKLDCFLGIGGIVTFKPRKTTPQEDTLTEIVKKMPLENLLLETDAPWLAPDPVRGTRNEPTYVWHIAHKIAKLRGLPCCKDLENITTENAIKAFDCRFV